MKNSKLFNKVELKPEILTHPNIPVPLHGINPRNIKGEAWWDKTRNEAKKRTGNCCSACGVQAIRAKRFKYLEGHEFFDIDYMTGRCEVISIEPLCHYCHNFIHSGRLSMIMGTGKTKKEVKAILEHGFKILSDNKLQCFPFTLSFAKELGVNTHGVTAYTLKGDPLLIWEDYCLVLDGEEYRKPNPNAVTDVDEEEWGDEYLDPYDQYHLQWGE